MTTKERAVKIISKLPNDSTVADIMAALYAQLKIEEGLRELDAGKGIAYSTAKRRLKKWLA